MITSLIRLFIALIALSISHVALGEIDDNGPFDDSDVNDAPDVFVKLEAVPLAALEKLRAEAHGFEFEEVELSGDNGVIQYELEWQRDGRTFDTTVGIEGDLVKRDEHLAMTDVPEAVSNTVKAFFPPGAKLDAEHSIKVSYEVQTTVVGEKRALEINPMGVILNVAGIDSVDLTNNDSNGFPYGTSYLISRTLKSEALPESVYKRTLHETQNSDKFNATQRENYIGTSTYEIEWQADGRDFEAAISDAGDLLDKRQTLHYHELPALVRSVVDAHFPMSEERELVMKLTSTYDIDADHTTPNYQLIVDPSGCILDASGSPDPTASAPIVRVEGDGLVIQHRVLLGMPKPRLEFSSRLAGSWTEIQMVPNDAAFLEARLAKKADGAYFRISFDLAPTSKD